MIALWLLVGVVVAGPVAVLAAFLLFEIVRSLLSFWLACAEELRIPGVRGVRSRLDRYL